MKNNLLFIEIYRCKIPLIIIAWLVLTIFNLGKAYHIDDSFHLEAALYLQENPLKPMSGMIIWGDNPSKLHEHNQPPLFFYLIALVSALFGTNEIVLHIFFSAIVFFMLYYFQMIIQLLPIKPKRLGIAYPLYKYNLNFHL